MLRFENVEDITVEFGHRHRRQLDGCVLESHGGWATLFFVFQDYVSGEWQPPRCTVQRWTKVGRYWRKSTGINIRPEVLDVLFIEHAQRRGDGTYDP